MTGPDLRSTLQAALAARYTIEREFEGGGMSRVFVAREHALGRLVVIKLLRPELAGAVSSERFRREIQLLAALQHPHVVPMLTAGEADGLPYFVMPFVEGRSLRERLAEGPVPVREAVPILKDVARALAYAHGRGVVHRDIKPDNVLLSGGSAVVIDFGIVKAVNDARTFGDEGLTGIGLTIGTPRYMAPEQAAGGAVDARTDLYAFGVMAYEMLAGEMPVSGGTPAQWMVAHANTAPAPIRARLPGIPAPLADLVMRCLAKDPDGRPASAADALTMLDAVPITGAAPTVTLAATRRARAMPVVAALVVLATVAVGAIVLRRGGRTPPEFAAPAALVVAVRPLAVLSGADAALGTAAADQVSAGIARAAVVRLVDSATAARDSGLVVSGSIVGVGDSVRLRLDVSDARTGTRLRSLPEAVGTRANPLAALAEPTDRLLGALVLWQHDDFGPAAVSQVRPPRLATAQLLVTAMDQMLGDTAAMRRGQEVARQARALEPALPLTRVVEYRAQGNNPVRRPLFKPLEDSLLAARSTLEPFESAFLDWAYFGLARAGDPVEVTRRIAQFAPRSAMGRNLVLALLTANRPREALEYLERAGPYYRRFNNDSVAAQAGYEGMRANILHYLGDRAAERRAAEAAVKLAPRQALAIFYDLRARASDGDTVGLRERVGDLAGSRGGQSVFESSIVLLNQLGGEMIAHGQGDLGRYVLQQAARAYQTAPAEVQGVYDNRMRMGFTLYNLGQLDEARPIFEEMRLADTIDTRATGMLARIAVQQERRPELAALRAEMDKRGAKQPQMLRYREESFLLAVEGNDDQAIAYMRRALELGESFNVRSNLHWYPDFARLRKRAEFRKLFEPEG